MGGILKFTTTIKAFAVFLLLLTLVPSSFADQSKELAAISAAENFLHLVDTGHYSESWDASSNVFKQRVSKQQWTKQLESLQPTFGKIINREIKGQYYTKSLPRTSDGEYIVIQFSTLFTNFKNALETVVPTLESDGEWRVTFYFIQQTANNAINLTEYTSAF